MPTVTSMPTIWNDLLDLFYPNLCKLCGKKLIEGEELICLRCLCDLPHTGFHKRPDNPVEQLLAGKVPIEHGTAFLHYEKGGKTQRLMHSLKYYDHPEIGFLLGRQAARELLSDRSPLCEVDLLIPVPLHPHKKKKRGYNQSERIAAGINSILAVPVCTNCVTRITQTDTQTHRSVYDRWQNVCSIFSVTNPEALKNKHILLIDDVITTGATITACAQALQKVPGIRISVLALSVA